MTALEEPPPGSHPTCSGNPCTRVPGNSLHIVTLQLLVTLPCNLWVSDGDEVEALQNVHPQWRRIPTEMLPSARVIQQEHLNANHGALPGRGYLICLGMSRSHFTTLKNHLKRLTAFFYSVMAFSVYKNRARILRLKLFLLTPFIEDGNMNKMFYG